MALEPAVSLKDTSNTSDDNSFCRSWGNFHIGPEFRRVGSPPRLAATQNMTSPKLMVVPVFGPPHSIR